MGDKMDDYIEAAVRETERIRTDPVAWQKACEEEQRIAYEATNKRIEAGCSPLAIGFGNLVNAAFVLRTVAGRTEQNADEMFLAFRSAFLKGPEGYDT